MITFLIGFVFTALAMALAVMIITGLFYLIETGEYGVAVLLLCIPVCLIGGWTAVEHGLPWQ